MDKGKILGHKNLGEVVEVGKAVDTVKKGDKVVLQFNIGCGFCANCERGLSPTSGSCRGWREPPTVLRAWAPIKTVRQNIYACLTVTTTACNCPEAADEKGKGYLMLADIFPTGWHATRLANLQAGESIIIFGAGPVGLTAAMSARIQGASQILVVDGQPDRLRLAREIGSMP